MSSKEITIKTAVNGLTVEGSQSLIARQLVGDRVIIEPFTPDEFFDEEKKMAKPVGYKEPFMTGRILSIGGGEYGTSIPKSMKVDLVVHYWHQQAIEYTLDKAKYHLIRASDIFMYL